MAMEINGLNTNQANANKARNGQSVAAPKTGSAQDGSAAAKTGAESTVQISARGQMLNRLQNQMGKETPVNREKVESLKIAVANGSYKPDAQAIAKRMLESDQSF